MAHDSTRQAFTAALEEAIAVINADKKAAAQSYIRLTKDSSDVGLIEEILADPQVAFTTTPQAIQKYIDFMARTKTIRRRADDWKEMFFANIHSKPGN